MVNAGRCDAKSIGKRWSCWTSRPRTIGKRYIFQTPLAKPMEAAEWIWRRSTQRFPLALEARSEKCRVFQWLGGGGPNSQAFSNGVGVTASSGFQWLWRRGLKNVTFSMFLGGGSKHSGVFQWLQCHSLQRISWALKM